MKLAKCPYCGKRVSYFTAFFMHNEGEHLCDKCKKESNVVIKKSIWGPFIAAVVIAILIVLGFLMVTDRTNFWFMLFVAVPFFVFYCFTPFFIVLKPKKKHMDSLYDTHMVEAPRVVPQTSKVLPTFVDDVILDDDEFKPSIDQDIFEAIKKDRSAVAKVDGGTKPISSFENISSNVAPASDKTMPVADLKEIAQKHKEDHEEIERKVDALFDEEKLDEEIGVSDSKEVIEEKVDEVLDNEEEVKIFEKPSKEDDIKEYVKEVKKAEETEADIDKEIQDKVNAVLDSDEVKVDSWEVEEETPEVKEEVEEVEEKIETTKDEVEEKPIEEITADDLDPDFKLEEKSYDLSLFE